MGEAKSAACSPDVLMIANRPPGSVLARTVLITLCRLSVGRVSWARTDGTPTPPSSNPPYHMRTEEMAESERPYSLPHRAV